MIAQTRLTLQSRIITSMVIATIALIAIFTFLQVNNQLKTLSQHNIFKAKLGSMLAKDAVENALSEIQEPQQQTKILSQAVNDLKQSGIVEEISLIGKDGQIAVSTNKTLHKLSPKEGHIINTLFQSTDQPRQYQAHIDRQKKEIYQYSPIKYGTAPDTAYIAKISYSLGNLNDALRQVYASCIFIAIMVVLANIFLTVVLSKTIIGPLKILNDATKEIAGGKLQLRVNLPTGDEIEEVANTFNDMTAALVRMKERAENANPLTKLPGNNVIHEEIERRIAEKKKFVVVYADLDNFKSFNDKYGIGAGDQAIKLTAQIMQESLKSGGADDFLGHEGGDDFVLLTTPEKAQVVTSYIITEFDKRIRGLYTKEDLEQGFIVAKSREGETKHFPIMTISLAGVSNINQPLTSYGQVTNICASVKKIVKKTQRSVFTLDKIYEDTQAQPRH